MSNEISLEQLEKKLKVSEDRVSRLTAEADVLRGSMNRLKEEIKVLNKQLEDKGSVNIKLLEKISQVGNNDDQQNVIVELKSKMLEKECEIIKIKQSLSEAIKLNGKCLSSETKQNLSSLCEFLKRCYKESQSVFVKTNIKEWRELLSQLTT